MTLPTELLMDRRWQRTLNVRTQLIHQQIGAMQRLVMESGAGPEYLQSSCSQLYALLDQVYLEDLAVAKALDEADLLLRLQGAELQGNNPKLSLVISIMSDVRKQVGAMIKTLVNSLHETLPFPKNFELGLCSFGTGSLFLGFALPKSPSGDDPIICAAEAALQTLDEVSSLIDQPEGWHQICDRFPDPKQRDAALSALGQLAPSGRKGVSLIEMSGRAFSRSPWRRLDPQTRLKVNSLLERTYSEQVEVEVTGTVRAIDLDFRRCDVRRVESGLPDLRCVYIANLDAQASEWLNKTLRFRGQAELWQGQPRLLRITHVIPYHESN